MGTRSQYEHEVANARRTAHALLLIGAVTLVVGLAVLVYAFIAVLFEDIPGDQLENLLGVVGVGSVVSGIAMFATSWNLRISASRLEIDLASKVR
jgi:hypothetical protein